MKDLNFSMRQVGDVTVLDLAGRIALGETSSELHLNLKSLVEQGKRHVIINLGQVSAIDSSGLGTLVAGYTTLEKADGELKLVNLSPKVAELMTITKLYTVFEIFEDEASAVASFGLTDGSSIPDALAAKVSDSSIL